MPHEHISDEGPSHKYRTEIPNTIVRGMRSQGLSAYAKWLYVYLKSVSGDGGECWQSTSTIAAGSGLSRMSVSRAKRELATHHLIVLTSGPRSNRDASHIRIVDIWLENMQEFSSQCTTQVHQHVLEKTDEYDSGVPNRYTGVPVGDTKKISLKKISLKKIPKQDYNTLVELAQTIPPDEGHLLHVSTNRKGKKRGSALTPRKLIELYNAEIPFGHPEVETFSPARLTLAARALRQQPDKEYWLQVFDEIHLSALLQGKCPPRDGAKKPWVATFDVLMAKNKHGVEIHTRAYEGAYRDATARNVLPYRQRPQEEDDHAENHDSSG